MARHAGAQPTTNDRATAAVQRSRAERAIAAHNRAVTRRRGATWAVDSVNDPTQRGVSQRNRRLVTTSTVGRSKLNPSRTRWTRRSFTRLLNVAHRGHGASGRATRTDTSNPPAAHSTAPVTSNSSALPAHA